MTMRCSLGLLLPVVVLLVQTQVCTSVRDLSANYTFTAILDESYQLYWNYDLHKGSISFAVRVQTEGWVGFGVSPNGQMPGSDVVIGWVDDQGVALLQDRYAEGRFQPPIDDSQDWRLEFGEQENGYTILEFSRNLTTCDPRDLEIKTDTSRVVWSWHSDDPADPNSVPFHQHFGSTSLNLLGGLNNPPPEPEDSDSFIIASNNVTIPNDTDTTYWCTGLRLPQKVREKTRYVYKISPAISEANAPYVHHMLIYLCSELNHTSVGQGSVCDSARVDIQECRGGYTIGAWAVGGTDFVFPEGVAFPVGGSGAREYIVIEMHYDNPLLHSGVVDSSGLEFFYTNNKATHEAGVLTVGHGVRPSMVIPPNADNYEVVGFCSGSCTKQFFPPDGVTVFGNALHTHIYGHGLRIRHMRDNKECNATEELETLDENLQYDFNYQQFVHLPPVKVMPGDSLVLQCFYRTSGTDRNSPVLGGESTREEMCLSFLYYYPQVDLSYCSSFAQSPYSFSSFAEKHIKESDRESLLTGLAEDNVEQFLPILSAVDWTPDAVMNFQNSVLNSPQLHYCYSDIEEMSSYGWEEIPSSECPYQAPDTCSGFEPLACCDRLPTENVTTTTEPTASPDISLIDQYNFHAVLDREGMYELFWTYNLEEETISFAVRVKTEGWVGFGLSPNGQMPGSDVVIGWVDNQGNAYLHDRFAQHRARPLIDVSQDWILEYGKQVDGHTILAFNRRLQTCDPFDLDIKAETARVVWSYHNQDPANSDPNLVLQHSHQGSKSLNLLGGLLDIPEEPADARSFIIQNHNLVIPSDTDTTYWCSAFRIPEELRMEKKYIYKVSPYISSSDVAPYVHHMVLYQCKDLSHISLNTSGDVCDSAHLDIQECLGGQILAAWAVGGDDFYFPEGVALPLGGMADSHYTVLEMHYDNPNLHSGLLDSSGLRFHYTAIPPREEAGILTLGHSVDPNMIIPPQADSYTVQALCPGSCTAKYLPQEGIKVFSNFLHAHTTGYGLNVQHFRKNEECDVTEELEPIDSNMQYDFDYQQTTVLPREVIIKPGDAIVLQCFYRTKGGRYNRDDVVVGGESTREEMCVSFAYYYPRTDLSFCISTLSDKSFVSFVQETVSPPNQALVLDTLNHADKFGGEAIKQALSNIEWTPEAIESLQSSVNSSEVVTVCIGDSYDPPLLEAHMIPRSECPYQASDSCSGFEPQTCCERVQVAATDHGVKTASLSLFSVICVLWTLSFMFYL